MKTKNAEEFLRNKNIGINKDWGYTDLDGNEHTLFELMDEYASLREKETAIEFLMFHLGKSGALAQYQRDIYERKFDEYTKHKEG